MSSNTAPSNAAPTGGNAPPTGGNTNPPTAGGNAPTTSGVSTLPTAATLSSLASLRRFDIPKLESDASNYNSWQHRVRRLLRLWKLWSVVDGTYPRPTTPTNLGEWLTIDEEAQAQIEFTVRDGAPLDTVIAATSAKEAWDLLSERYNGVGNARVGHLMTQVYNTRFTENEPLETQINTLLSCIRTINTLGHPFDDHLAAISLINALPASLGTLKTLLTDTQATATTADIKARILRDEQRRIIESGSTAAAFFAKAGKRPQRGERRERTVEKPSGSTSTKSCAHCKFNGHDILECRKLKRALKEAKDSDPKPSAKLAITNGEDDDSDTETVLSSTETARAMVSLSTHEDIGDQWILDSGATRTMCSNREWFSTFTQLPTPTTVVLANKHEILGTGSGNIAVLTKARGQWHRAVLQNVLYVPELHGYLLSVRQLVDRGNSIQFTKDGCQLLDQKGNIFCEVNHKGSLYPLPIRVTMPNSARVAVTQLDRFPSEGEVIHTALLTYSNVSKADAQTWHRRLGHLNDRAVLCMARQGMVSGMEITAGGTQDSQCEPCLSGKQTRSIIPKDTLTRANLVLGRVFTDVCGKLPTRSHEGFEYFVTFIDDKSRKVSVQGLKHKSDVAQHLKDFISRSETETGHLLKVLRSDGGGEYTGSTLVQWLNTKGIKRELTTPDTPQQNGVAERMNRTLLDKVRSMLTDAELPDTYWYDALLYAAHLHNVSPTRALEDMTPEEAWSGNKPDVSRLRVFGCKAFVHIPDKQRTKLGAKSLVCTFLGHAPNRAAYRFVHRPSRRFLESRDVIFDEGGQTTRFDRIILEDNIADTRYDTVTQTPALQTSHPLPSSQSSVVTPLPSLTINLPQTTPSTPLLTPLTPLTPMTDSSAQEDTTSSTNSRPRRTTRAPIRDDDPRYSVTSYGKQRRTNERVSVAKASDMTDPRTYAEAMARTDAAEWEVACDTERRAFEHMGVYEIVPRPKGRKVVGSRWVFRIKRGPDGAVQKYKARVVAQGYTQIEGVDYDETFAPVAKLASLRMILALAAEHDLELQQMDVKSAYLNGDLREEIFMEAPPGFEVPDGMVLRLIKAVYGTKQGGRVWYEEISEKLGTMGYQRTEADHAVFTRAGGDASIIALYVDDITMAGKSLKAINQDKENLKRFYEMTDLGDLSWILGMHVVRDRAKGWVSVSQEKYSNDILERLGKADCRPMVTPVLAGEHLTKVSAPEVDVKPYQSAVGALMYSMTGTRPDLAFAVGSLGRHSAKPGVEHQHALERTLRYLRGTSDCGLVFQRGTPRGTELLGYVDADWASDVNDRKSTSGFVFMLGGAAISWGSKKQTSVALSSTEAEYIAAAHAAKEAIWLRRLLTELGENLESPTTLFVDNQSAIAIARNPEFHDRTKHIEVRYHFLRQVVDSKEVHLEYLPTGEQVADILTKGLSREKHETFVRKMGLRHRV
jgi:transposase InsO family protein